MTISLNLRPMAILTFAWLLWPLAALAASEPVAPPASKPAAAGLFERVESHAWPAEVESLFAGTKSVLRAVERDGSVLEALGHRLYRIRGGSREELVCTMDTGPGTIHVLAADPIGATYIGADRGVFMVSPEVQVLDPLHLQDGVPRGRPLAMSVDARRRLWVATDEEFGCVGTSQFFGRVVGTREEWGGARPRALVTGHDGSILLVLEDGVVRYRPDIGPRPLIHSLLANGKPFQPDSPFVLPFGEGLELKLQAEAAGGAQFRYRWDDRLPWVPGQEGTIPRRGLAPGLRRVEVVALDRDLNASAPLTMGVNVLWPAYWQPRLALTAGLAFVLGLAAIRFGPRPRPKVPDARQRALVSTFLVFILGLELVAALIPHARGWPFVGFSMYTSLYSRGDLAYRFTIEGLGPGGSRHLIRAADTGLDYLDQHVERPLIRHGAPAGRELVQWLNKRHPNRPIHGVEVRAYRYRLTRDGPVPVAPIVLSRYEEDHADPGSLGPALVR